MNPKIRTSYWAKPIPLRQFDWDAVTDDYEPGHPIGYGRTEPEAIADLMEQLTENDEQLRWEVETSQ
jgi:hypothetical protein